MSAPKMAVTTSRSIHLTGNEFGMLRALIRGEWRKTMRRRDKAAEKFGAAYDSSSHDSRLVFLESLYRHLGGDPEHMRHEWAVDRLITED